MVETRTIPDWQREVQRRFGTVFLGAGEGQDGKLHVEWHEILGRCCGLANP
jgi:hypothetical protein